MKPWKPCEHCYLKDNYCENVERGLPCVPVQEYLKSGYEIKRIQNLLEVSEKEHYKTLQQLAIATKALKGIRNVWENNPKMLSYIARVANRKSKQALKEIDLVGTSTKEEE